MATSSPDGWPLPDLGSVADGPAAFAALAAGIEGTINNPNVVSYTPTWTSDGTRQPSNTSSRVGLYQLSRKICKFYASLTFGASTDGGLGVLRVGIPFSGNSGMAVQMVHSRIFIPGGGYFPGVGEIRANESTVLNMFPASYTNTNIAYWQNSDDTSLQSHSIPNTGVYSVGNGGQIWISGSYFTN